MYRTPKALFLAPDGTIYPDELIWSGVIPAELNVKPCPYSQAGRLPEVLPLNEADATYSVDKGLPGDLCLTCAKQQLGHLGHWRGHSGQKFPQTLLPPRLFKCRMWLWLVVPGLYHQQPTILADNGAIS